MRNGELVRPIIRTVKAAHGHLTRTGQLKPISPIYMRDTMCRHAHWLRFDAKKKEWVQTKAPMDVAATLLARDGVWRISGNRRRDRMSDHAIRRVAAREAGL